MDVAEFLRLYPLRASQLMWLVGAGASAASGVPTAGNLIWEFKRAIYCTDHRVSRRSLQDLSSNAVRARLQAYFDSKQGYPSINSDDEYAFYFEQAFPAAADRRRLLDSHLSAAAPSYGHLAMAALMKLGKMRLVWTTNFDRLIEDAAAKVMQTTSRLSVVSLENAQQLSTVFGEERYPILSKLHGDFLSVRLKNTESELRQQDAGMRQQLQLSCQRFGLVVCGYSGRDKSVMQSLRDCLKGGFPNGLFWLHRQDEEPLPAVTSFLEEARASGVSAELIGIQTFDELLGDVFDTLTDLPNDIADVVQRTNQRSKPAPVPRTGTQFPLIRFNAYPLTVLPTVCRRVVCSVGGTRELLEAINAKGGRIVAARKKAGVLAFGRDEDIRDVLGSYAISEFDAFPIEERRLRYESAELSLLYQAFARSLARQRPLTLTDPRGRVLSIDPLRTNDPLLAGLKRATGGLMGRVPSTQVEWREGVRLQFDYRLNRLWLLIEPTTIAECVRDSPDYDASREFIRQRKAGRFNSKWNELLNAWSHVLGAGVRSAQLSAFGINDGVDAVFNLDAKNAFSFRA